MDTLTADQRKELLQQVVSQPSSVDQLSVEQIAVLRRDINVLSPTFSDTTCYANITLINARDSYLKALHVTAMIGFLFRQAHTYENDQMRVNEMNKFARDTANMTPNTEELAEAVRERDARIAAANKVSREHVMKFLMQIFAYDPDRHVRGAHVDVNGRAFGNQREKLEELQRRVDTALSTAPKISERLAASPERATEYTRGAIMSSYNLIVDATASISSAIRSLSSGLTPEDCLGILAKHQLKLQEIAGDLSKLATPLSLADTAAALRVEPAAEVFLNLDRYIQNNYEELRVITEAVYPHPKDIDFSITLHSVHDSAESAAEFVDLHQSEFKLPIQTIASGGNTLCGPFKENRERIRFYNKHTKILEEMMKAHESGAKLAADFVRKTVSQAKKKNIEDVGADDPELAEYRKLMSQAGSFGAKPALTAEERRELAEVTARAREIHDDLVVPDDAIQYKIFTPRETPEGELVGLTENITYTQAEIPLHMDPAYGEEYQPVRAPDEKISDVYVKKLVSVDGQKSVVTTRKPAKK